jgi:hypothetical protein
MGLDEPCSVAHRVLPTNAYALPGHLTNTVTRYFHASNETRYFNANIVTRYFNANIVTRHLNANIVTRPSNAKPKDEHPACQKPSQDPMLVVSTIYIYIYYTYIILYYINTLYMYVYISKGLMPT